MNAISGNIKQVVAAAMVFAVVAGTSGCQLIDQIEAAIQSAATALGSSEIAADTVSDALTSALEVDELTQINGDLGTVVPEVSTDLSGSAGARATISGRSQMAPLAVGDECPRTAVDRFGDELPADRICSAFLPDGARVSVYVPEGAARASDLVVVDFLQSFDRDGVTGTVRVEDLEAPVGTSQANLWRHDVAAVREAFGRPGERVAYRIERLLGNMNGCPDRERTSDVCDADADLADEFFGYSVTTEFVDGGRVMEWVTPDQPAERPEVAAIASGTYEKVIEYPVGHRLVSERLVVTFDREAQTAIIEGERVHSDGGLGKLLIEVDGAVTTIDEDWASGRTVDGIVNRDDGTFERVVVYEPGHFRVRLAEAGTMSDAGGEIERVIERTDGEVRVVDVVTVVSGNQVTVSYDEQGGGTGTVTIVREGDQRSLVGTATSAAGVLMDMEAVEDADGTLRVNIWIDRPTVSCDLDTDRDAEQDGVAYLERDIDGRITGEAQHCDQDGSIVESEIAVEPGEPARIKDRGQAAERRITRDIRITTR